MKLAGIRVLLAKPGLDGHDRGARVVDRYLRDAGMEAIHIGIRRTPETIVEAATQENADVVRLSILSGTRLELSPPIIDGLKKKGKEDAIIIAGGIIPEDDIPALQEMGVKAVFGPGTSPQDIIPFIQQEVKDRPER